MKLLLLHGPPAAGKLTVANEIARRTGFKVFHNHLTIDCLTPIFDFGTPSFEKLIDSIRLDIIAEAVRVGQDMIYTFCYAKGGDDRHVAEVISRVEQHGGEFCPVLLVCDRDVLRERVVAESRKEHGKIGEPAHLDQLIEKYELFSPFPDRETLIIDNTDLPPEKVAEKIIDHFSLK